MFFSAEIARAAASVQNVRCVPVEEVQGSGEWMLE